MCVKVGSALTALLFHCADQLSCAFDAREPCTIFGAFSPRTSVSHDKIRTSLYCARRSRQDDAWSINCYANPARSVPIKDRERVMDSMDLEREKGITIARRTLPFSGTGYRITS